MDINSYHIYNLIKISICKYIVTPLTCSKEDIIELSNNILILVNNNNYKYDEWYQLFNKYLKIYSIGEINNLICYLKNHI